MELLNTKDGSVDMPISLITDFANKVLETLKDNFIGFYLYGSITMGGWNPQRSDIDFLVVSKRPLNQDEIEKVKYIHKLFENTVVGPKIEGIYVDLALLQNKAFDETCLRIEDGLPIFGKTELGNDTILALIQYGKPILGWPIEKLSLNVSEQEVRDAVYTMLVEDEPEIDSADFKLLYYILVNSLRCICILELHRLATKTDAIEHTKYLLGDVLYRKMVDYQAGIIERFEIDRAKVKDIVAYGKSLK